jgi:hypothetical protein
MRKRVLESAATLALSTFASMATVSAFAADMPSIAALSPSTIYNWSGFYVGSIAGPTHGSYDPRTAAIPGNYLSAPADIAAVAAGGAQSIKPTGFSGGAEAGYNWQSGHWLLGVETDLSAIHLNGSVNGGPVPYAVGPRSIFPANQIVSSSTPTPTPTGSLRFDRASGSCKTTGCSMPPAGSR